MELKVKVKALAKKRPLIDTLPVQVPDHISSANDLVTVIVLDNVRAFNQKQSDQPLFQYLTEDEIDNQSVTGKIGFGDKKNDKHQDERRAVENALQCFEDGIFRMLLAGNEVEYGQDIQPQDGDELVFIRLTMLAGRLW